MLKGKFFWLFLLATAVYVLGLFIPVMDVDSAQYAGISREMAETDNYLEVYLQGRDYLDKPPLLFWLSAVFFELFGMAEWSFKLPSLLFTLLGVYSTYQLGRLLYNRPTGRLAAMLLYTCQAFFLFNNDVRTDTILTGAVIFAIWQLAMWLTTRQWLFLIGAAVGIACAMLAKGPIGLMVPVLAIAGFIIGRKKWKEFFLWQYLILALLVLLFISPMLWGLYKQYDQQPDKVTMMVTPEGLQPEVGVSGLKFYWWTQSFGRITGENVWKNNAGPFFFVHNFLWSFLPWSILFIFALISRVREFLVHALKGEEWPELLTLTGFLLPFLVLSMSSFKLPHYIFILYPLAAIMVARWWYYDVFGSMISRHWLNTALIFQVIEAVLSMVILYFIYVEIFPLTQWWPAVITGALIVLSLFYFSNTAAKRLNLIIASVLVSVAVNFSLNAWFYPNLLKYQGGSEVNEILRNRNIPLNNTYTFHYYSFSLNYYAEGKVTNANLPGLKKELLEGGEVYAVTDSEGIKILRDHFLVNPLEQLDTYSITLLNWNFLNPDTRTTYLKPVYIVKLVRTF